MVYEIDGKYYILASRKYRQVSIEKDGKDGYNVIPVKDVEAIEYSKKINAKQVSVENAYKKSGKSKFKEE